MDEIAKKESHNRRSKYKEGRDSSVPNILQLGDDGHLINLINRRSVYLTKSEAMILRRLANTPKNICSKQTLLAYINTHPEDVDDKIIDVFISKIRKRFREICPDGQLIDTVWSSGYRLNSSIAMTIVGETYFVTVEVDKKMHDELVEYAYERSTDVSTMLRALIKRYLPKYKEHVKAISPK